MGELLRLLRTEYGLRCDRRAVYAALDKLRAVGCHIPEYQDDGEQPPPCTCFGTGGCANITENPFERNDCAFMEKKPTGKFEFVQSLVIIDPVAGIFGNVAHK